MNKKVSREAIGSAEQQERKPEFFFIHNFQEDWLNAHDRLQTNKSLTTVEQVETEFLKELTRAARTINSDTEFAKFVINNQRHLPSSFIFMKDMKQTEPHREIDPLQHTLKMIGELDTQELNDNERFIVRMTAVFHDLGKVIGPKRGDHTQASTLLARRYLERINLTEQELEQVLKQIRLHDALGELARRDGRNILNPNDVAAFFDSLEELKMNKVIVLADVKSIPGLAQYQQEIEPIFRLMERRLTAQENWIEDEPTDPLPFAEINLENVYEAIDNMYPDVYFDDLPDYHTDVEARRARFNKEYGESMEYFEKALIQFSYDRDGDMLRLLQAMGRELDRSYVIYLEDKYKISLERIRIAVELFNLTYLLWNMDNQLSVRKLPEDEWNELMDSPSDWAINKFRRQLKEIMKSAEFLSSYVVRATHVTKIENAMLIDETNTLYKSDSREAPHFEGDGVYLGILGGYENWDEMQGFEDDSDIYMPLIPLADTLPIIHAYSRPRSMALALGEILDLQPWHSKEEEESDDNQKAEKREGPAEQEELAVVHGLIQYRQDSKMYDYETVEWKLDLLEELLGVKATLVTDEFGELAVVMDTSKKPIVWATLCRALRIRRFIPLSSLRFSNVPKEIQEILIPQVINKQETPETIKEYQPIRNLAARDRWEEYFS